MHLLATGDRIEKYRGVCDGVMFDMADDGGTLLVLFRNPSAEETEQIKKGKLRFGLYIKEGIIFMLSKFGSLAWTDAPYHAALSKKLTRMENLAPSKGYGVVIVLIDTANGEVKALRQVGLGTEYSKKLREAIEKQRTELFSAGEYNRKLNETYTNYSTEDMVRFSEADCVIGR